MSMGDRHMEANGAAGGSSSEPAGPSPDAARLRLELVRSFHACWKALRLRGVSDPGFHRVLEELGRVLGELDSLGIDASIHRHGRGLVSCGSALPLRGLERPVIEALAEELRAAGIGGMRFAGRWDGAEMARFLHLCESWRQEQPVGSARELLQERAEEMEAMGVTSVTLEPAIEDPAGESDAWDAIPELGEIRRRARETFFEALRAARMYLGSMARSSPPGLRRARSVVHRIVDIVVEEEFSLLAMTALREFDEYTFMHSVNVCVLSVALGQRLGLNKRELSDLGLAALLHDLGKLAVPKSVLKKPGSLGPVEWEIVKTHPLEGVRRLVALDAWSEVAKTVMIVGLEHHMRYDLTGYPRLGDDWPLGVYSRIVAIADCYDAMTSRPAYGGEALTPHRVVRHMLARSGKNFDPLLMKIFARLIGLFPVGSFVRLSNGEVGLVIATNPDFPARPLVRQVVDAAGSVVDPSNLLLLDLAEASPGLEIAEALDGSELGLDLAAYLA